MVVFGLYFQHTGPPHPPRIRANIWLPTSSFSFSWKLKGSVLPESSHFSLNSNHRPRTRQMMAEVLSPANLDWITAKKKWLTKWFMDDKAHPLTNCKVINEGGWRNSSRHLTLSPLSLTDGFLFLFPSIPPPKQPFPSTFLFCKNVNQCLFVSLLLLVLPKP